MRLIKSGVFFLACVAATLSFGETDEEKGLAIATRYDHSDKGFAHSQVELTMVLRDASGQEASRNLSMKTLEVTDENLGDRSLIVFNNPPDVRGTALLSHAKILEPDDQWLYLPALKRVKRISSANKSGPFVGSEFAFEDFTAQELGKFSYKFLREEPCGEDAPELTCDVVERYPQYEKSGYSKQISWIDQRDYQLRKIEFYDRKEDLLKTLLFREYKQYGTFWRPHLLSMSNHKSGKSTDMKYGEFDFATELKESDFVKSVLKRQR